MTLPPDLHPELRQFLLEIIADNAKLRDRLDRAERQIRCLTIDLDETFVLSTVTHELLMRPVIG